MITYFGIVILECVFTLSDKFDISVRDLPLIVNVGTAIYFLALVIVVLRENWQTVAEQTMITLLKEEGIEKTETITKSSYINLE